MIRKGFPRPRLLGAGFYLLLWAIWWLAFLPYAVPFLSLLALMGWFFLATQAASARQAFLRILVLGLPFWGIHLAWIRHVPVEPWVRPWLWAGVLVLAFLESTFWGVMASVYRRWLPSSPIRRALWAGVLWGTYEFLRAQSALGFLWTPLWSSTVRLMDLAGTLAWVGPYAWSILWVAIAVGFLEGFQHRAVPVFAGSAGLLIALWGTGAWVRTHLPPPDGWLRVAVVQPSVLPRVLYDPEEWPSMRRVYDSLWASLPENVDLVLFSESAFPGMYRFTQSTRAYIQRLQAQHPVPLLFGDADLWIERGRRRFFNAALLIDPEGRIQDVYHKQQLVPFGEWIPYEDRIPLLRHINFGQGHYAPGIRTRPVRMPGLPQLGVLICFEAIFPRYARQHVRHGARILVNITNDGWFGPTLGPREHFQLHRFRALETGRVYVRAARTGISGWVDAAGNVRDTLGLMHRGLKVYRVPLYTHRTPYVQYGESIFFLFAVLGLWMSLDPLRRRQDA